MYLFLFNSFVFFVYKLCLHFCFNYLFLLFFVYIFLTKLFIYFVCIICLYLKKIWYFKSFCSYFNFFVYKFVYISGLGKKLNTLYDIRSELHDMYKDFRENFNDPSSEEIFNMVTKETPQTFYTGKLVMATVTNFQYKKPQGEELDKAAPLRKGEGESKLVDNEAF